MRTMINQELERIRRERQYTSDGMLLYAHFLVRLFRLGGYYLRGLWTLRTAQRKGRFVFLRGRLKIRNEGVLEIGNKVRIWSTIHPSQIHVGRSAQLTVGDGCYLNGAFIAASGRVSIGKNCFLGPMSHVQDSPFFGLDPEQAALHARPVVIEDDAWLATRCTILEGVRIGRGAVVAVGAVVMENVPPYCVVAGNPARVVKPLDRGGTPDVVPLKHLPQTRLRN